MFRKFFKSRIYVFLAIILLLGFFLRFHNFTVLPRHGATFDEFAWTWLGINIIQKHVPVSWSAQPQYNNRYHLRYQGAAFWIVEPYLEHPPLFGLIAGSFSLLNGAKDMLDVTLNKIRPLALILGVFSIFMIFILSREVYGKGVALLASLIYATIPTLVIGSRIVQNENFLIPFWLLSLYLIIRYLKTGNKTLRNTAAVIAGLLSLAKVPWLVVGLSLSMLLSYKGKWKDAFLVGSITVIIFSIFIVYGLYLDKELFINLWKLQIARYDISFSGFFSIFRDPLLVDRYYLDGWIFFGWFSIFLLSKEFKKHYLLLIPFLCYLIMYIFAIPNEPAHGWYRYPFYPFLIIAIANVIMDEYKKISLISFIFIFLVGLPALASTWEVSFGFSYVVYRIFILLGAFSVLFPLWTKRDRLNNNKIILYWFFLFIILNIFSTRMYSE
ncbi:MAG: glycosyltransferase family 39 protein [Patescibacteria group bacterium]|nr:glycosyltransferase family 39 protein [Patescibacteria group bacterium]